MIDLAISPDGSPILMAHGNANAVSVEIDAGGIRILSGRDVIAASTGFPPAALADIKRARQVEVILAGPAGIQGHSAVPNSGKSTFTPIPAILGRFVEGTRIHKDPSGKGAERTVNMIASAYFAKASVLASRGATGTVSHAAEFSRLLGDAAPALATPGPLASGRIAVVVACAVAEEMDAGSKLSLRADPDRLTIVCVDGNTPANLNVVINGSSGMTLRYADGKLSDFGPQRPAIRSAAGVEKSVVGDTYPSGIPVSALVDDAPVRAPGP